MRMSRLSGVAAAAAVSILLVGSWVRSTEKQAHAAAKPAVVWEYKTLYMSDSDRDVADQLNAAGRDGWELATVAVFTVGRSREFVFKRPAQ